MKKVQPKAIYEPQTVRLLVDTMEQESLMHAALFGPVGYERGARAGEPGLLLREHVDLRLGVLRMPREKGGLTDEPWPMSERGRGIMARYLASRHHEPPAVAKYLFPGSRSRVCGICHGRGRITRGIGPTRTVTVCYACRGEKRTFGISRQQVYRIFRGYAERLGLPHRHPHVLRHSIVTHLLDAGMDPEAVRRVVGHVRLATTLDYKGLAASSRAEAERILRGILGGKP